MPKKSKGYMIEAEILRDRISQLSHELLRLDIKIGELMQQRKAVKKVLKAQEKHMRELDKNMAFLDEIITLGKSK